MKIITFLIAFLSVFSAYAGYYGNTMIDIYDPDSGLYYKAIDVEQKSSGFLSKSSGSRIVNIAIYNPETNAHTLLFKPSKSRDINLFMFETGHEKGTVSFNKDQYHSNVKNNTLVQERKPRDQLLIGVRDNEKKLTVLWLAKKNGEGLKKMTTVPFASTWHIDVKNSKLRVVSTVNGSFKISSFDW